MNKLCLLVLCVLMQSLQGMFRKAEEKDLPSLLSLIDEQAVHDREKIVVLPEKFRRVALAYAIAQGKLFVAYKDDTLIGYKKLFLMSNATEKKEVLCDELRCYGPTAENTFSGSILSSGRFIEQQHALSEDIYDTCIYNGADFTAPQFRSQGINKALTDAALRDIHDEVLAHIKANNAKFITMVYGLTQSNAGDIPGGQTDRTIGISKAFSMFAQSLGVDQNATTVHARYKAFMPTFDLQSNILQPLPDNQSIPGFGCVLTYALRQDHE